MSVAQHDFLPATIPNLISAGIVNYMKSGDSLTLNKGREDTILSFSGGLIMDSNLDVPEATYAGFLGDPPDANYPTAKEWVEGIYDAGPPVVNHPGKFTGAFNIQTTYRGGIAFPFRIAWVIRPHIADKLSSSVMLGLGGWMSTPNIVTAVNFTYQVYDTWVTTPPISQNLSYNS